MMTIISNTVYGHSLILATCLILVAIFSRCDQADILTYGMYFFIIWYLVEFILAIRTDNFWMSSLQLGLASLGVFIFYVAIHFFCEKIGTPARGDGAGFGILMPVFLFILFFVLFSIIKGMMSLWASIFS